MEACTKCGGTGQYVPNSPNMFNCELGGDCSELDGWDKEQCKTCGYTACDCEAGQIWDIWQRKT